MRRSVAALVVVLLAVSAGCSLPFGAGGGQTATPDDSLWTDETPPGLSAEESRVTNATALTAAHANALVEFGFETDVRTNATVHQQGRVREVERRQQTVVEPDRAQYVYRVTNPGSRIDGWGNRSVRAIRAEADGQVSYRVRNDSATARQLSGVATILGPCLDDQFAVENVTRDGDETRIELRSETVPEQRCVLPQNATDVSDYEARAVVDQDGRVHRFVVTADYTLHGEDGDLRVTFTLVRAQVESFDRPEWVETALRDS